MLKRALEGLYVFLVQIVIRYLSTKPLLRNRYSELL